RAHPQVVSGDRAQLGDLEEWGYVLAYAVDRLDGRQGVLARDHVLALQLLSAAWRELHAEVRQTFMPGAGDVHLWGTRLGREAGDRVAVGWRECGPEQLRWRRNSSALYDAALHPDLVDALVLPVGEEADAVGARYDLLEVIFQPRQGQVFVHVLPHLERGNNVERDLRDHPQAAEADNRSLELRVLVARNSHHLAVGRDDLQRRYGRGQVAIAVPRAVRCGRTRAG